MLLLRAGHRRSFLGRFLNPVLTIEPLDATRGIDQTLLAGVKRMTVRADFHVKLVHGRTGFKSISTCASHNAAVIFGMNCSFHLTYPRSRQSRYHPKDKHTIQPVNDPRRRILAAFLGFVALAYANAGIARGEPTVPKPATSPSPAAASPAVAIPSGFAPPSRTELAPILKLAPPGPRRAERATAILDRQLAFQRQALHPEFSASLEHLFDLIPPRNSTLIRAASEYGRGDLPWTIEADGTHELCVEGYPNENSFFITMSPKCVKPEDVFRLGAYFALKPAANSLAGASVPSVIGSFGGEFKTNTFGFGAMVDAVASLLTETYGDLTPPWDTAPGKYNQHDIASRNRFRRELPTVDDKFHEYFTYENILDEFDGPGGPYVLFNFVGEVKYAAFKKYTDLYKFYADVGPTLTTQMDLTDAKGNYWMRAGFDRGKVSLTFMVRDGKLSAFDADHKPVGEPLALDSLRSGINHSRLSAHIRRLGMDFGLDNLNFANYYTRDNSGVSFEGRMEAIPQVIAPPGIEQGAELVAGEFMSALAQGSGGMRSRSSSRASRDGTIAFTSEVTAEFIYSPALEFFAKLGDSIAQANNEKVRQQERMLAEEFLDAFVKDYNNARPGILALDR
jgi:hypothetical protein